MSFFIWHGAMAPSYYPSATRVRTVVIFRPVSVAFRQRQEIISNLEHRGAIRCRCFKQRVQAMLQSVLSVFIRVPCYSSSHPKRCAKPSPPQRIIMLWFHSKARRAIGDNIFIHHLVVFTVQ